MSISKKIALSSLVLFCSISHARVKLYTLFTPSHAVLFNDWFLPSISALHEYDLVLEKHDQECKTAEFMSPGWKKTTRRKVNLILRAIKENWGSFFVYSDVDIQFFKSTLPAIRDALATHDMVFQQDTPEKKICTGFFACKANQKTKIFWEMVGKIMDVFPIYSDQASVNLLLEKAEFADLSWDLLPESFLDGGALTGETWKPGDACNIPRDVILHHANYAVGVNNKIEQLKQVKNKVSGR